MILFTTINMCVIARYLHFRTLFVIKWFLPSIFTVRVRTRTVFLPMQNVKNEEQGRKKDSFILYVCMLAFILLLFIFAHSITH